LTIRCLFCSDSMPLSLTPKVLNLSSMMLSVYLSTMACWFIFWIFSIGDRPSRCLWSDELLTESLNEITCDSDEIWMSGFSAVFWNLVGTCCLWASGSIMTDIECVSERLACLSSPGTRTLASWVDSTKFESLFCLLIPRNDLDYVS